MGTYRSDRAKANRRAYLRKYMRRYRRKYPERIRATERRRDKKARAAYRRNRRAAGLEDYKSALHRSYLRRKDKSRRETTAWRNSNRERWRQHMRAAKAKRRFAVGRYDADDVAALMIKQNGICVGCGEDISAQYHVDHIVPLVRGGTNWPSNLQLMCGTCNRSKGAKPMALWAAAPDHQVSTRARPGSRGPRAPW